MEINAAVAQKILDLVDFGLVKGIGAQEPGKMCVEAVVCYALGLQHGDDPACVSRALRTLKIRLNDSAWSSDRARAKGLRRLAVAQLGSAGSIDDKEFLRRVAELAIRKSVPEALRAAASIQKDVHKAAAMRNAADLCEREPTSENALKGKSAATAYDASASAAADAAAACAAAYAADAAYDASASASATAAYAACAAAYAACAAYDASADDAKNNARDKSLASFCEGVVQILIDMKVPGCQWLALTEVV